LAKSYSGPTAGNKIPASLKETWQTPANQIVVLLLWNFGSRFN